MGAEQKIQNSQLLTDVFGYWPSFHDAEVVQVSLDRDGDESGHGPRLDARVYVFEITPEVDPASGCYVLAKQTLVHIRFWGVVQLSLQEFNTQNALWGLSIQDISDRQMEYVSFEVTFSASFGMGADFQCHRVSVESVKPFTSAPDAG